MADQRKTLLLIDDDLNQLVLRKRVLELSGFTVIPASDVVRGMQLFESEAPDAVVVDYEMPRGRGDVLAAEIRRLNSAIPILMLSGCMSVPNSALRVVDRFIPKASPPTLLVNAIEFLVRDQEVLA